MSIRYFISIVCAALCIIVPTNAEDKVRYRVKLNISASDNVRGEVTSYLNRQLRQIDDIDIVDDDAWIVISIIALETSNKGGRATGYAFSVVAERPVRYRQARDAFAAKLDATMMALMDFSFDHTTTIMSHFIQIGGSDELETLCRRIVADLDGNVFESQRKFTRQLIDQLKKNQATPQR